MGRYNTRETIRESSPAINLVFSKVSGDFNNKIQQLMFPLKIIKSQSKFEEIGLDEGMDRRNEQFD